MKMPRTIAGVRTVALFEVIVFMVILFFVDRWAGPGNRFIDVRPHPLWIILLLVLFQYEIQEAIVTVVLMCIFLYAWNLPVQSATEMMFDYWFALSIRPIMWFGMSLVLGGLRHRNRLQIDEVEEQRDSAIHKEEVISQSFNKLKETNRALELRLSKELGSAIKIYEAAVILEDLEEDNRIDGINRIVASTLNPEKFSIFLKKDEGLILNSSYAWAPEDAYSRKFNRSSELFNALVVDKRILAASFADGEHLLRNQGVIAGPLIDTTSGEVFGMLKIEKMSFATLNHRTIQLFKLLCGWLGATLRKMSMVETLESETISSRTNRSYSYAFLQEQTEFLSILAKRIGFHLTKLNIRMINASELSDTERRESVLCMSTAIKNTLRKNDLLFDAKERGEEYAILLCGTGSEFIDLVIDKIQTQVREQCSCDLPAKYSYSYQILFESDRNPTWQGGTN